jgi:hypothetical protein
LGANEKEKFVEETRFVISNIYIENEEGEEQNFLRKPVALGKMHLLENQKTTLTNI